MTAPPQPLPPIPTSALSRSFVVSMIALAFLLFALGAGFIGYRWFITTEPNVLLLVDVPNLFDGGVVTVKSNDIPNTYTATIGGSTGYSIPFHIDPGSYTLTINVNDKEVYRTDFALGAGQMGHVDLAHAQPQPATTRAAP